MKGVKKLNAAIVAECERIYREGMKYPEQSTPRAYWAGRQFAFGRVAEDWTASGRTVQALADLCSERLGSYRNWTPKPHAFCQPWVFLHPCFYKVMHNSEMQSYRDLLVMLKDYCGVEPQRRTDVGTEAA